MTTPSAVDLVVMLPKATPQVECVIQQIKEDQSAQTIVHQNGSTEVETICRGNVVIRTKGELAFNVTLLYNSYFKGSRIIRLTIKGIV